MGMTRRDYLRKWPNHCKTCEAKTDSANPCQDCLAGLLCPRCGRLTNDAGEDAIDPVDATIPCRNCGWVQDAGMGRPPSRDMIRRAKREMTERNERERQSEIRSLRSRLAELEN